MFSSPPSFASGGDWNAISVPSLDHGIAHVHPFGRDALKVASICRDRVDRELRWARVQVSLEGDPRAVR
jgi:hypothetical protein